MTARAIAAIQYRVLTARRNAVLDNLATIGAAGHPELADRASRERTARRMFENFQLAWIEYLAGHRAARRDGPALEFRGAEHLYRALIRGHGAVIAASHLGGWELAGSAIARLGLSVHAVTGVQLHPVVAREVREWKRREGIHVHTPQEGFAPLVAALRAGGVVVLLVDGDVYSRALPAIFFGRRIPFPAGPAILARRAGVPILHAHAARGPDGRHRISFDGLDEPDPALPLREDLSRLTSLVARSQERNIAAHVSQWCIFRPLWNEADAA
ncbi:MAG TPA: lysophospholipid acyltransferase family protein [Candidatus Eisenbacteria bacterium]|nr:lysophospholipid acyltransferase family protein [Candidatus Eisenbacteria bacterium]